MTEPSVSPEPKESKFRLPRWAWILFISSIAINLLISGVGVGRYWAHHHGYWHGPHGMHHGGRFWGHLPYERRKELKALIREARKPVRPLWKEVRKHRKKVGEAMRAEPFDEASVRDAMKALSDAELAARRKGEETIISIAHQLSPEERKMFTRVLEWRHRRRRPGPL